MYKKEGNSVYGYNLINTESPKAPTLNNVSPLAFYNEWINYLDATENTIKTYTYTLKQFFVYCNNNNIKQPQRADVLSYKEYLKDTGHKATTIQVYIVAVKLFFSWLEQKGYYPNIAEHIKGAKIEAGFKKDYLTSEQVKRLLSSIDRSKPEGLRDYAIILLIVTTGLRTISISRANIEDISVFADSAVLYYQGKGRQSRNEYVRITEPAEAAIRAYIKQRKPASDKEPLFVAISNKNKNGRLTTRSISRICKKHLINAGFNSGRLTAHSLRHTAATLAILNGSTVQEVQQVLGHSNINTTLIYSHALERQKNTTEQNITNAIFNN